jgi:hypothetical protein
MSFANPMAWLWAALVIPVVIFYVLKIRLRRVPVSTVIFWRQIFDEKKPRSLWQRLRHLVSLLVQLALLFLLVAALAEPFFDWDALTPRRVVLVIDNSASMNATDTEPTRLAKAKEVAKKIVAGLRYQDEMAVVSAGTQPRVVCGLTGHQRTLREALDAVPATDGPTVLADAVALARRLAAEGGAQDARIVVVTDGCAEKAAELLDGPNVQVVRVGEPRGNVGITRFQVRRSAIDPIGYEILTEVTNHSDEPTKDLRLRVTLNGNVLDIKPLTLAPNASWSGVIENSTADGGLLTAELTVKGEKEDAPLADALAADNVAHALLPKREQQPVFVSSPQGNLFLRMVMAANPVVKLEASRELPKELPASTVKVFHRSVPAKLPPGPVFVVDPASDCDLWKVGEKLQTPVVTQQDKDSPLMTHVKLDNVLMPEGRKLAFTPAAGKPQVLAASVTGDPLFVAIDRAEGKVVVLTVNIDMGDLPFRTAFPILAANTLNYFAGVQGELQEALSTGATAEVALPPQAAGTSEFLLRAPDGSTRRLPAGGVKTTVGPFDRRGLWAVVPDAPNAEPIMQYAVNLANKAESDIRPPDGLKAPATAQDTGLTGGFLGRPVWLYLIGLAWLLAGLEWYLYQRRWIS